MSALDRIYKLHYNAFEKGICEKFGCTKSEAISLFNEALIKLHRNVMAGGFQAEWDGGLPGWLFKTGSNAYLQMLKKERRIPVIQHSTVTDIPELADDDSGKYDPEIDMLENRALEALERMPDSCHRLLKMFYIEEKSLIEISETLNRTYKSVKKDRWRCLQNLKKTFIP